MREKGFTLVETLVSLIAGGLLLGIVSWVISGLSDDLSELQDKSMGSEALIASETLDPIFSNARFVDQLGSVLDRSEKHLDFQMLPPLALNSSGYLDARLVVTGDKKTQSLVLSWPGTQLRPVILLSDHQEISLAYVANETAAEDIQILRAVKVHSTDKHGRKRILKLRSRISDRGACNFDPITGACR